MTTLRRHSQNVGVTTLPDLSGHSKKRGRCSRIIEGDKQDALLLKGADVLALLRGTDVLALLRGINILQLMKATLSEFARANTYA